MEWAERQSHRAENGDAIAASQATHEQRGQRDSECPRERGNQPAGALRVTENLDRKMQEPKIKRGLKHPECRRRNLGHRKPGSDQRVVLVHPKRVLSQLIEPKRRRDGQSQAGPQKDRV